MKPLNVKVSQYRAANCTPLATWTKTCVAMFPVFVFFYFLVFIVKLCPHVLRLALQFLLCVFFPSFQCFFCSFPRLFLIPSLVFVSQYTVFCSPSCLCQFFLSSPMMPPGVLLQCLLMVCFCLFVPCVFIGLYFDCVDNLSFCLFDSLLFFWDSLGFCKFSFC